MRFLEPPKDVDHLALVEVDHLYGVVTQFGDKNTMTVQIDRDVIDPAADIAKTNFGLSWSAGFTVSANVSLAQRDSTRVPTPMSAAK